MPIDSATLIWCILLPAMIAIVGSMVCWRLAKRVDVDESQTMNASVISFAWWSAVTLSLMSSESLSLWPEDAWPKVVLPMLVAVILVSPRMKHISGIGFIVGVIAVIAAALAMPTGEGWEDTLPLHQPWIAAISVAAICNTWSLQRMSQRGAERWLPLVILGAIACPAIIGAATYGALLQTCLAAIVATLVIAICAASGLLPTSSAIIFPSMLLTTTMIASGRFYSYAEISPLAYGLALFAPSIVAFADRLVTQKSIAVRITIAALTATAIVGAIVYRFLLA